MNKAFPVFLAYISFVLMACNNNEPKTGTKQEQTTTVGPADNADNPEELQKYLDDQAKGTTDTGGTVIKTGDSTRVRKKSLFFKKNNGSLGLPKDSTQKLKQASQKK